MVKGARCKICRSIHRAIIDKWLFEAIPFSEISKRAAELKPVLKISKKNIFTHNKAHRLKSIQVQTPQQGAESETQREAAETDNAILLCEKIIAQVLKAIEDKSMSPTITEALKATEILQRIREGNPWESALRKFVSEVSLDHGFRA